MTRAWSDLFTWSHPYADRAVLHDDGAISVLLEWDGIDSELMAAEERSAVWRGIYRVFELLEFDWCAEWHLWREHDDRLVATYEAQKVVRGQPFASFVRSELSAFLRPKALVNSVGLVVTQLPARRRLSLRRALTEQARRADTLLEALERLCPQLPGAHAVGILQFARRVWQGCAPRPLEGLPPIAVDMRLQLSEQWVTVGPEDLLRAPRDREVVLLYMYPDAAPGWAQTLAALPVPLHLCQIVKPLPRRAAIARVERQRQLIRGLSRRGRETTELATVAALDTFLAFVEQHHLDLFHNAFVVHLYGPDGRRQEQLRKLRDLIDGRGGQIRTNEWLRLPYFRVAQPGQGYLCPVYRPDHLWQVANMAPVQVFGAGDADAECLRLGRAGQPVGLNLTKRAVQHSFTIAMTGGGKGVDKAVAIAETYPLGVDWYIVEIGETYRWVVEAYGGTYLAIDPGVTSVNPLPLYSADQNLAPEQALATIRALAFLLTDGSVDLSVHEAAAAQAALQGLYAKPRPDQEGPSLAQLPDALRCLSPTVAEQRPAAARMAANLESFLETAEGRVFCQPDSAQIRRGLCGVDLKLVDQASPKLLKFYLVFLSLKFGHMALADRTPTRVLLDELHRFVAQAPEVVGRLVAELARMGRKERASIDLVTQGLGEIDAIDKEVLNAMAIRQLLYRNDQWDDIAARLEMPVGATAAWKRFSWPVQEGPRPALRAQDGHWHRLWLTFPQTLLDLADSSAWALDTKHVIGQSELDPIRRLRLLAQMRDKRT